MAQQLGTAGQSLLGPANDAFVHSMRITSLVAALVAMAGGFVVLRWMPGRPRPGGRNRRGREDSYEAELGIMEQDIMLEHRRPRGMTSHAARDPGSGAGR